MAPEVIGKEEYNPKVADIFAAGVILFVMITQHSPFNRAETEDRYYKLIHSQKWEKFWKIYSKDTISEEFKDLFSKMMKKNPKDRLTIDQIRAHPWFSGKVAKPERVRRSLYRRYKKIQKQAKNNDSGKIVKLVTNYYKVDDGDTLVDAAVKVATDHQYFYKKSEDYYRVLVKIEAEGVVTRIQVNVVKHTENQTRRLELVKIAGNDDVFNKAFEKFQQYCDTSF